MKIRNVHQYEIIFEKNIMPLKFVILLEGTLVNVIYLFYKDFKLRKKKK